MGILPLLGSTIRLETINVLHRQHYIVNKTRFMTIHQKKCDLFRSCLHQFSKRTSTVNKNLEDFSRVFACTNISNARHRILNLHESPSIQQIVHLHTSSFKSSWSVQDMSSDPTACSSQGVSDVGAPSDLPSCPLWDLSQDVQVMSEARELFNQAVNSVLPNQMIRRKLSYCSRTLVLEVGACKYQLNKNVYVVGFGKAVLGMAKALEDCVGQHVVRGILSVPVGARDALQQEGKRDMLLCPGTNIQVFEGAADNLPDSEAHTTALKIQELVEGLQEDDILIVLISGGGSALLPCPEYPLTLEDMLTLTRQMSRAGASIMDLNTVRKQVDSLKGGGLAKLALPAQVISLILSDIIGDPLDFIASGPTVPDHSTPEDCFNIFTSFGMTDSVPHPVINLLSERMRLRNENITDPTDWSRVQNILVGSNNIACDNICEKSVPLGYSPYVLTTEQEGEAREVGRMFALLAQYLALCLTAETKHENLTGVQDTLMSEFKISESSVNEIYKHTLQARKDNLGVCIVAGGESTVTIRGHGKGGRNQEMSISAALELDRLLIKSPSSNKSKAVLPPSVSLAFLSAGTDGQDGPTPAAGGVVGLAFTSLAQASGLDVSKFLEDNDSYSLLAQVNQGANLVMTGLTGTNVMDIHLLLVKLRK